MKGKKRWQGWKSFFDFPGVDEYQSKRCSMLLLFLIAGVPVLFAFSISHLVLGNYLTSSIDFLTAFVFFLFIFRLKSLPDDPYTPRVSAAFLVLLLLYFLGYGGDDGSAIMWIFTFPIVAFFLFGTKEGAIWIALFFLFAELLMFNGDLIGTYPYDNGFHVRVPIAFILVTIFTYGFESLRSRSHNSMIEEQKKLLDERKKLSNAKQEIEDAYHELNRTTNLLKEEEEKFRRIVTNAHAIIFIIDKDMKFRLSEGRSLSLLGLEPGELNGFAVEETFENHQEIIDGIQQAMRGDISRAIIEIQKLYFDIFYSPYQNARGENIGVIAMAIDVTGMKKAEEEKLQLKEKLMQSQKMEAIGTLAGGIAHDFNNILLAIQGFAELAKHDVPKDSSPAEDLENILKASRRAKDLIQQILDYSRQTEYSRNPIFIISAIKEILKLLRATIPTTIEIHPEISAKDAVVSANQTQIHQVLMNLCTNAVHSMKDAKGIIEIGLHERELTAEDFSKTEDLAPGPYIEISIKDNGSGIDQKIIDRIFDPFFTTKNIGEGSGMGLAVAQGIIKNHNGFIAVESEQEKGSIFRVFLPTIKNRTEVGEHAVPSLPIGNEKILVVDDEEFVAEVVTRNLENLGYKVTMKTSSGEALELFRSQPEEYDLVITDQLMPHMTGQDLAREMIHIREDIPVILCTGFATEKNEELIKEIGIKAFVMKPFSTYIISKAIRKVLDET